MCAFLLLQQARAEAPASLTVCAHNDQAASAGASPREDGWLLARTRRCAAECRIHCHGLSPAPTEWLRSPRVTAHDTSFLVRSADECQCRAEVEAAAAAEAAGGAHSHCRCCLLADKSAHSPVETPLKVARGLRLMKALVMAR